MPAHNNGCYGDRKMMKMIVIALILNQIKVKRIKRWKYDRFQAMQSISDVVISHGWIFDEN